MPGKKQAHTLNTVGRILGWAENIGDPDLWTWARDAAAASGEFRDLARFLAYCKLYEHTVRGVVQTDPKARVGAITFVLQSPVD